MPPRQNRLAAEASPYLLQHAGNPVDWWPWSTEAFDEAKRRDVPVFLSIGYSTCYWCHVMERESFEHEPTAALMNERFVCIKLDREERPDLDDLYMAATQIMTGRGGWPMSAFLEPDTRRPYWCGTYFPREPRHGLPSFSQVLRGMSDAYRNQRSQVREQAASLAASVEEHLAQSEDPVAIGAAQVQAAAAALIQMHDRREGGFGGAPKFPQPVYLEFLLDVLDVSADDHTTAAIQSALRLTLDRMAIGGLFDQVGGGFHRYCVDATWTVPHFEKMLYDNAQLARVYARAARRFDDAFYGEITRRTLDYILDEMTGAHGGFFSAQDAEVDHREGLNYLWTKPEIADALPPDDAAHAIALYGLAAGANFQDPHHPGDGPKNVLRLAARPDPADDARRHRINKALLSARSTRKQPHLDDKVLTSWNGMTLAALAAGYTLLRDPRYADAAARAADFILTSMRDDQGRLTRATRDQRSGGAAVLEDYAFLAQGLLAMHDAGLGSDRYRDEALAIVRVAQRDFADPAGGFFDTPIARDDVFVRPRSTYDGALPSASGVMLHNLITLGNTDAALALLRSLSHAIAQSPVATVNATRALLRLLASDAALAGRLDFGPPAPPPTPSESADFTPVVVYADTDRVRVTADRPTAFSLVIKIAPGWHIAAADQPSSAPGVRPLRVGLVSGQGVAVYADYPEGEAFDTGVAEAQPILVHTGEVHLRVALERAEGIGPSPGRPILGVTFQPCTDTACEAPRTLELAVAIDLD